ncbi:MAG: D-alanyl-D-alanine carboxypeptidase/D-alanyl-D-alanine-endopeptidase [Myxococcota bacterium]
MRRAAASRRFHSPSAVIIGGVVFSLFALAVPSPLTSRSASEGGGEVAPEPGPPASTRSDDLARLESDLDALVEGCVLADSRVGIHVKSLITGETLYARGADALLNPASNIKLMTAAAALEILGPEYRFKTEIWADSPPNPAGVIRGNIYIKGFGDPSFVTERMVRLVLDLWNMGVRRITGDVVVDDSFFDQRREGPGWEQETSDRPYIAPVGAVSLNRNAVAIHVRPAGRIGARAEITLDPASDYFVLDNRVTTGSRRSRMGQRSYSIAEGNRQRVLVRGVHPIHYNPRTHWKRIDNPPHYFGQTFRSFMARQGVRFNRRRVRTALVPQNAVLLHTAYSASLSEILGPLNKFSNNHMAEMLLKTMGAERQGVPGTWEKGALAVEEFLAAIGIEPGSYVLRNGSGLNDVNRVSPRQMTTLLAYIWYRFQMSPEFVVSLPVSGRDGTIRWRMEETGGFIRAKTGTLENVSALSGYVGTPAGEVLAFSVIVNDHAGSLSDVIAGIDGVPTRLVTFRGADPSRGGHSSPPLPMEAACDVEERAAVYLALHAAANRNHVRYLLRALDNENDGLLKALLADAVLRSRDGQDGSLLVSVFEPSPEIMGRLLGLTGRLTEPVPILSSLADLAARGDERAIRSLLEAAHAAGGSLQMTEWFSQALSEVGRAAPDELLSVLVEMQSAQRGEHVLELLAQGLRVEEEEPSIPGGHPFRDLLQKVARGLRRSSEGEEGTAASAVGERLERLIEGPPGEGEGMEEGSSPELEQEEGGLQEHPSASPPAIARPEAAAG